MMKSLKYFLLYGSLIMVFLSPILACEDEGKIITKYCIGTNAIEQYIDSTCNTSYKETDCGTLEACREGTCIDINQNSCSEVGGADLCGAEEVCNGNILNVKEENCCSVPCSKIVECYADSDCCLGQYCEATTCIEIPAEEVTTPEETSKESFGAKLIGWLTFWN